MFRATIGGLGLTGVIVKAKLQLSRALSGWIESEKILFKNLTEFFQHSKDSESGFESSVAWFDCSTKKSGRGSFIRGNHIPSNKPNPRPPKSLVGMPIVPPFSLINRATLSPLNSAYYNLQKFSKNKKVESMWSFYYPLDSISEWNRSYGPNGFYQYQAVVPPANAFEATTEMLKIIQRSRQGSFLAVLKTFGAIKSKGLISFPTEGTTLALDFPNNGDATRKLFEQLDSVVRDAGGRLNPSKDALMSSEMFISGYPNHSLFEKFRDTGISSGFSKRIFGS
jgi:FAD/FMN-containing dehydrogenase